MSHQPFGAEDRDRAQDERAPHSVEQRAPLTQDTSSDLT